MSESTSRTSRAAHRRQRQGAAAARAPLGRVHHHLVREGHLGQVRAGGPGLPAGPAPASPPLACGGRALGQPIRDGGLEEAEESFARRRSSSATRPCTSMIICACSALTTRNSAMTAAWTATVAPRSGSWEGSAADVAGPPRRADRPARLRAVPDSHTALIHQVKPLATRRLHARPRGLNSFEDSWKTDGWADPAARRAFASQDQRAATPPFPHFAVTDIHTPREVAVSPEETSIGSSR
jgi:hypothetical protein